MLISNNNNKSNTSMSGKPEEPRLLEKEEKCDKARTQYWTAIKLYRDDLDRDRTAVDYDDRADLKDRTAVDYYDLGIALEDIGKLQSAKEEYQNSLHLKPDFARAKQALKAVPQQEKRSDCDYSLNPDSNGVPH